MVETRSGKMQDPAQERIQAEESAKPQPGATIGRDASSDPVVLNPNIDIPKYDGTEDPRPWIESLEEIGFLYHWADYIISRYAAMNMTGSAKTWLNLHKASFTSWENIKIRLIQDFSLDANKEELRMKLNRMQHWNEPAIRFAEDILVLCNKVDPAMEEETKIEHVIGGLKKEYSFALYLNPPKTTDDLLVVCKKMDYFEKKYRERVEKSRNLYNGPRYSRPQQQSRYVPPTAARNYQTTSRPQAPVSNNYKNDSPPTPRQYRNNFPQPSTPRRPYNPNFVPKPNLQRNTYNKSQEVSKNRTEDGRPICFKCNKPGHVARYCRVKFIRILEEDPADTQEKVEEKCQMNETSEKSGPRLYADIGTFEALVDTGADLSVVDLRTALDTGHGISKLAKICAGPDGKKLDMVGSIFLNIKIDDETLSHNFVILKTHLRTLILGRDFLKKMNAKIDCKQETIKYDLTNNHDEINFEMLKIKSAKDSIVPECSMKLIKALVETEDGEYIIEESSKMFQTNGLRLARSLINVINRETHIWITNPYPRPLKIMKNQTLAFGSSPAKINVSREREVEKNEEPRFQINENLSPKEQKELKQVLERYGDLFSSRLGRTNLAKHRIDTEDAKPIKHKPYRVSAKERDIIKEQIDEMLTEGIIRPSSSPWSFPVILVKKRDGKYRFCVDYRKLNNVTVKDVYPIPRIDEVMDTLQGSTHFSAIDLRSGYWQVEVEERDKEKTAFTTAHGLYEFNVMPFGLCNAPATFERNMENMLGNLRWQICLCYLDDVIIYSPDFPTHLKRLEAVFRCFRESNLRLNDKKCRFAFEELEILGYITSKHGIKPAEHNIKAVRNFPRPKKVKEVQSFLGMCSYYRKFIKDFSKIADPLTNLIKKSVSFTWTERQEEAFQTLKTALLSPPILGHFNPNAPTYVHTDASNIGIGATLVQDIGGEEKVISYLSRTLSKAEQNYSTTEKECLAVVWSMSKLRPYLYGRHFKIVTDHHALCWLKNLKDPTGRLARWALKIQEYDFDIIHKSGKKHLDADGLSRGPLPETDWDEDFERLFLNQITDEEDKFIESVKKNLNGSRRSIAQNFKEEDGCLFKKNPNPEGRAWLLVVPENKKREIMKEYHNHMSNGHLGVARTMYRIKSKYFWPSMLKDVSEFVKTCHLCQSRKGSNQLPSGLLQPIPPANFPFERIGIDFVGPLPSTKNRKKWIIVLSDYYTRYAETRAVSEATVKEVSKFLVEDIFLRHGAPQYLISDRGSQFTSNLMKEVMKTCKIKHCFTTSYHPQTNGLTERLNRTLINMLSMYVNTDQKNWDEILPFITHAYNTTIQETTGYSPFFLMFGREPTSLLDDRNISVDIDKDDYDEYIKHHLDKINRTRKLVINNTIKTQERMKKNYDKKHMERSYEPGELVAVWTPIRKIGKCEKLLRKYFGPYRILKKLSNVNYLIEPKDNPGQDPLIVHVSRIKPYFERIDEVNHEDFEAVPNMEADAFAADSNMSADAAPPYPWSGTLAEVHQPDKYFTPHENVVTERFKFRRRVQKDDESIDNYLISLRELSKSCEFRNLEADMIRDQIIEKCNNKQLKEKLLQQENLTLSKTIDIARMLEISRKEIRLLEPQNDQTLNRVQNKPKKHYNANNFNKGRFTNQGTPSFSGASKPKCYRCGLDIHSAQECGAKKMTCSYCNKLGHLFRACRNRPNQNNNRNDKSFNQTKVKTIQEENKTERCRRIPYAMVEAVNQELDKMLENGIIEEVHQGSEWVSNIIVVPKRDSEEIRLCIDLREVNKAILRERHPIPTIGNMLHALKGAKVFAKLDAKKGFWQVDLDPQSRPLTTFITHRGCYRFCKVPFGLSSAPEVYQKGMDSILLDLKGVICYLDDVVVNAKDRQELEERLRKVLQRFDKDLKESLTCLAYYNLNSPTELITDASPIGLGAVLIQTQQNGIKRPIAYASRSLTDTEKRYSQIEKETLGCVWAIEHFNTYIWGRKFVLETDNKPLIYMLNPKNGAVLPPRIQRLSWRLQPYMTLDLVLLPCVLKMDSPIASPLVCVPKKNGKIRICADFKRTLNPFIEDVKYPIPNIDNVLHSFFGKSIFSKIDLSSAYHQILLDEESQKLTVISTHKGLFKYKRLPFGIKSGATIFQRTMDNIFSGLKNVIIYLDDILIASSDVNEHISDIETVMNKLSYFNFSINKEKSLFFVDEINYLGHRINKNGIYPLEDKLDSIKKCPKPSNISELKSFLGMLSFYSKFVKNLSIHANPLFSLLKKSYNWNWKKEHDQAFEKCKNLISTKTCLTHYSQDLPLYVTCDASNYGIGGYISHIVNGIEKPITFVSRTLNDTEKKYSQIEKEGLSIFFTLNRLKQFLYGRKFIINTDHKPLLAIFGDKNNLPALVANRLHRWSLSISNFNFEIKYTKGTEIPLADFLSRFPNPEKGEKEEEMGEILLIENSILDYVLVSYKTQEDPTLRKLYKLVKYDNGVQFREKTKSVTAPNSGVQFREKTKSVTSPNIGVQFREKINSAISPNIGVQFRENTKSVTSPNSGVQFREKTKSVTSPNSGVEFREKTKSVTSPNSGVQFREKTKSVTSPNSGVQFREKTNSATSPNCGVQFREKTKPVTSPNSGVQFREKTKSVTSSNIGVQLREKTKSVTSPNIGVQFREKTNSATSPNIEVQLREKTKSVTSPNSGVQFREKTKSVKSSISGGSSGFGLARPSIGSPRALQSRSGSRLDGQLGRQKRGGRSHSNGSIALKYDCAHTCALDPPQGYVHVDRGFRRLGCPLRLNTPKLPSIENA
ncbi:hypothetical protein LAZ67_5002793, partial [Cordylochernes scorpioides]